MAFRNLDSAGQFLGGVTDPLPVEWVSDGSVVRLAGVHDRTTSLPSR
jgi:hypothetical protein